MKMQHAVVGAFVVLSLSVLGPAFSTPAGPASSGTGHAGAPAPLPATSLLPEVDVADVPSEPDVAVPVPTPAEVSLPEPAALPVLPDPVPVAPAPETSVVPAPAVPAPAPAGSVSIGVEISPEPLPPLPVPPTEALLEGNLTHVVLEGDHFGEDVPVLHAHEDTSQQLSFVETASGLVQVNDASLTEIPSGTPVSLHASSYQVSALANASGYQAVSLQSTGSIRTTSAAGGDHQVTVISVVTPGTTSNPHDVGQVIHLINSEVSAFWSSQTDGRHTFRVVKALAHVGIGVGCNTPDALWNEAARLAGFTPGENKHLVVLVPPNSPGCHSGAGSVGQGPSYGGSLYARMASVPVLTHELGHNMGLFHSNAWVCSAGPDTGSCRLKEYHDAFDVMGASGSAMGNLSGAQLERFGYRREARLPVTSSVQTDIHPMGSDNGTRVVKVSIPQGGEYYVEYRTALGQDNFLRIDPRRPTYGVQVRKVHNDLSTVLFDAQWTGDADHNQALIPGEAISLENGRLVVRVHAMDATAANVSIVVDGVPANVPATNTLQIITPTINRLFMSRWGPVRVSGIASAPEGTVLWQVQDRTEGTVVGQGHATTGANGHVAAFDFLLEVPEGSWTLYMWVPDESDLEEGALAPERSQRVNFTMRLG